MTDTWDKIDKLIDGFAIAAQRVEYRSTDENIKNLDVARSALRAAIDAVVNKLTDALSCNEKLSGENMKLVEANAALEAQLAEADADAERLDAKWVREYDGDYSCNYCESVVDFERTEIEGEYNQTCKHDADCAHVLHVARLSKRGQG